MTRKIVFISYSHDSDEHREKVLALSDGRLFEHLQENTEHQPDSLDGLQPLYQAVGHGCQAGRQQEACDKVYFDRILRGQEAYLYFAAHCCCDVTMAGV